MQRTKKQNTTLWALANKLDKSKSDVKTLVSQVSDQRTESSTELTTTECQQIINALQSEYNDKLPQFKSMRSKILYLCNTLFGWEFYQGSKDWQHFNNWMLSKHTVHKKKLSRLSYQQLIDTINQLETMAAKEKET